MKDHEIIELVMTRVAKHYGIPIIRILCPYNYLQVYYQRVAAYLLSQVIPDWFVCELLRLDKDELPIHKKSAIAMIDTEDSLNELVTGILTTIKIKRAA